MEGYRQYGSLVQRHDVVSEIPQLHFRERIGAEVDVRTLVMTYTRYWTLNEVSQQKKMETTTVPLDEYGFRIPLYAIFKCPYRRT